MSRITAVFETLASDNQAALIPYITAGDPKPEATVELMNTLVEAGADILELGVPFSDPMADGPTIQAACERALEFNVSLENVLDMVKAFRLDNDKTPVVLMGYLNPIEVMGYTAFCDKATSVGVDGILVVDSPPEESDELKQALDKTSIDMIFLAAPTTSLERIRTIENSSSGFLYYVSLKGVTGSAALDTQAVNEKLDQIKAATNLPVGVGFGIKDAKTAAEMAKFADAVVVGSVLVNMIAKSPENLNKIKISMSKLVKSMSRSIKKAREGSK